MAFWYSKKQVENKIESYKLGYLIEGGYDSKNNCAILTFLDPQTQETFIWRDTTGHLSYLYTDAPKDKAKELLGDRVEEVREDLKYNSITDKYVNLTKVLSKVPTDIGGDSSDAFRNILSSYGHNVWEAWIRYHNSYCYDKGLEYGMPYLVFKDRIAPYSTPQNKNRASYVYNLLIGVGAEDSDALIHFIKLFETEMPVISFVSIDIEVLPSQENLVPDPKFPNEQVICISLVDSKGKRTVLILQRDEGEAPKIVIPNADIRFFTSELVMMEVCMGIIEKYPVVVTFNGDSFDVSYMFNRMVKLGGNRFNIPFYLHKMKDEATYKKGVHLDIYHFFKNKSIQTYAFKGEYKRYGLDDISEALIKKKKIHLDKPMGYLTYQELAEYCLNDSMLTTELMTYNNNMVMNLIITICRMSNLTMSQVCRSKISVWTRSTFYYFHRMKNILIPSQEELVRKGGTQTEAGIKGKKYKGAIVKDIAKAGARFNVVVADFASLYPSEVKYKNICYSTINCSHEECKVNKVPETTHHICTKRKGIMPEIIGALRDARVYYYKDQAKKNPDANLRAFYSTFEQAIKVYINASYGVFGSEEFALYCPPVAESITAYGRTDMTAVVNHAVEIGVDVFYGDTDSIFMNNPTIEQTTNLQKWARESLHLDLGIDKVYRVGFFSTRKKNYLGVYEDGKLDIKGLSGKKSHIPAIIKRPFDETKKIISGIHTIRDIEPAKDKIKILTKEAHKRIKDGNYELNDLAYAVTMQRELDSYETNPQHVKAAKLMEEKGIHVFIGNEIRFVKATNELKVMPVDGGDKKLVDTKAYIDQLRSVMEQVFDSMDISYEYDIEGSPKPTKLGDFFPESKKK